ncbi:MAG: tetratricopeptide repeat protein [Bacteroidales bacterium]|nr:tetratricopeptide repeat protein [Bacteroidales bacterium]
MAQTKVTDSIKQTESKRQNNSMYLDALNQKILGNHEDAILLFEQTISKYPDDHASMYELAEIYGLKKEFPLAVNYALRAVDLQPDNEWYNILLAQLYQSNNEMIKAIAVWENLCKKSNNKPEHLESLAMAYINNEDYDKAAATYDLLEAQMGVTEELSIQKYQLYKTSGKVKKGYEELEKLIAAYPNETRYYSILAEAYLESGMRKNAFAMYQKVLKINPDDPYVHIALADYYRMEDNMKQAMEELKIGFANASLEMDEKLQIFGAFIQLAQQNAEINSHLPEISKILIKTHPDDPRAWSIYADVMLLTKNWSEAQKALIKVVDNDGSKYVAWEQLLYIDYELKDFKNLENHSASAIKLFPVQYTPYLMNGIAHFQLKNFGKAVQVLERGKDYVYDDSNTLEDFYNLLGDGYHELGNMEKCYEYYDKILALNPANSIVLNNYAYYLSLDGKDLEKAEKMSYESLRLDANNASNMDTYGWVLYKMKRYQDAKAWIGKAMEKEPSAAVYEHYGDVLYQLGDVNGAVNYWKKAQAETGEKGAFLERKIADKKLYE